MRNGGKMDRMEMRAWDGVGCFDTSLALTILRNFRMRINSTSLAFPYYHHPPDSSLIYSGCLA